MLDSPHTSLKNAIVARIQAMITATDITGIATASVISRKVPSFHDFGTGKTYAFPGIIVANVGNEQVSPQNNHENEVGYPVLLAIAAEETTAVLNTMLTQNEGTYLSWRHVLIKEFTTCGIVTTTPQAVTFHKSQLETGVISDWNKFANEKQWFSSLVFRFFTRVRNRVAP